MSKEDFREKIEEHRQTIEDEESTTPSRMSRANRKPQTKKTKKTRNPLITILFVVFFVQLVGLFYVLVFYEPNDKETAAETKSDEIIVGVEKNSEVASSKKVTDDKDAEETQKEKEKADDEAAKLAAQQAAEKQAAEKKAEEQQQQAEEQQKASKTHVVKGNETLYRIAVNFYGDGSQSNIDKIKNANGLGSETISVGQTLIIPE